MPSSRTATPSSTSASRRYIWSRSNFDGFTFTYSSNTSVSSAPSSVAETSLGSTLSTVNGLNGLPLYSADGLPVSELLAAPASTSSTGVPVKLITAWRSCRPSRTVISVLSPSVATSDGECLTRGASDEYTAMRDRSTSDEFTASVNEIPISPVPRSMRAPRSTGLLVTTAVATLGSLARSIPARFSKAPACIKPASGDSYAATAAFCASFRTITTVLPSDASASDAPFSRTLSAVFSVSRMRTRPKLTFVDVLTSSSNVMYSRPRSWLSSTFTATGAVVSVPRTSRISWTPSSRYPVTAAYVEAPAANVATPLAPLSIVNWLPWGPPESSHACPDRAIWAGLAMLTICTPLQKSPVRPVLPSDSHVTIAYGSPLCVNVSIA